MEGGFWSGEGARPGELGGELYSEVADESDSAKNEYEMSLDIQSKLAIISFSFLVSHANRSGSKISLG